MTYPQQQSPGWGAMPPQQSPFAGAQPMQQGWGPMPGQSQQAPVDQQFDADDTFDNAGGVIGAPSFQWPEVADPQNPRRITPVIGSTIQGEIVDVYMTVVKDAKTKQPKLNKNQKQMPQANLTLQTSLRNWEGVKKVPLIDPSNPAMGTLPASEDTGLRRIYVKFLLLDAVSKAIKASGQLSPKTNQPGGAPRKGAMIAVRVTGHRETGADNPLTEYEAQYRPPAVVTPTEQAWEATVEPAVRDIQQPAPMTQLQQAVQAGVQEAAAQQAPPAQAAPQPQAPAAPPAGDPWAGATQGNTGAFAPPPY